MSRLLVVCLLLTSLPAQAEVMRYQRSDGRLYFTNLPPSRLPTPSPSTSSAPALDATTRELVSTRHLIQELARQHDIEPQLVHAIIRVESNFNPRAISRAGAQGLMQLMPATAARYQVKDPFNPRANIEGGIRYLKDLLQQFPGDLRRVLAAYNAGEQTVYRYGGMPPYPETQRYVEQVLTLYGAAGFDREIYRYRNPNGSILFTNIPR